MLLHRSCLRLQRSGAPSVAAMTLLRRRDNQCGPSRHLNESTMIRSTRPLKWTEPDLKDAAPQVPQPGQTRCPASPGPRPNDQQPRAATPLRQHSVRAAHMPMRLHSRHPWCSCSQLQAPKRSSRELPTPHRCRLQSPRCRANPSHKRTGGALTRRWQATGWLDPSTVGQTQVYGTGCHMCASSGSELAKHVHSSWHTRI